VNGNQVGCIQAGKSPPSGLPRLFRETLKYSALPTAQGRAPKISGCKLLILGAIGKPRFSDGER
jgi:hypothetical protein